MRDDQADTAPFSTAQGQANYVRSTLAVVVNGDVKLTLRPGDVVIIRKVT